MRESKSLSLSPQSDLGSTTAALLSKTLKQWSPILNLSPEGEPVWQVSHIFSATCCQVTIWNHWGILLALASPLTAAQG